MCVPVQFCEVITVSWLKHLSGQVIRVLVDYLDHVTLCSKLKVAVMEQQQWADICRLQGERKASTLFLTPQDTQQSDTPAPPLTHSSPLCLLLLPPAENARCLQHLCRLSIRRCLGRLRLRSPVFMSFLPLPGRLKDYILYREYDLYGQQSSTPS